MSKTSKQGRFASLFVISGRVVEDITYWEPENRSSRRSDRSIEQLNDRARYNSICRSKTMLRRLINANVGYFVQANGRVHRTVFVTLTYAKDAEDMLLCVSDFRKWVGKFEFMLGLKLEWICVPEIQISRKVSTGKAVVHFHVLFFNLPYIHHGRDFIRKTWEQGFQVDIRSVKQKDGIASYVAKYVGKQLGTVLQPYKHSYLRSRGLNLPTKIPDTEPEFYDINEKLGFYKPVWGPVDLRHGIKYARYEVDFKI